MSCCRINSATKAAAGCRLNTEVEHNTSSTTIETMKEGLSENPFAFGTAPKTYCFFFYLPSYMNCSETNVVENCQHGTAGARRQIDAEALIFLRPASSRKSLIQVSTSKLGDIL